MLLEKGHLATTTESSVFTSVSLTYIDGPEDLHN
jgi:hypothetical protein